MSSYLESIKKNQVYLWYFIFFLSFAGMLGSLYYSNYGDPVRNIMAGEVFPFGGGFVPCLFCWYARILMYPMVAISLVGIIKNDKSFTDYILPLAALGVVLQGYQYYVQKFLSGEIGVCGSGPSCTRIYVEYFGFATIPFLGLVAFLLITGACILNWWINRSSNENDSKTTREPFDNDSITIR